ncbi:DUF488 family protein [Alkalicoccus urumqiensis]|uniref:DNA repair protein n=1 Tax=Alkalicoccus urumqiensis TaxID=1548213 RepID=A0A2P6MJB1_ALKUR|nr:DUF488 domain-containing protein [Alkalicoccus urumqiensis]PRO66355.1 DNA repair protein [Alkalicoccus urumqiensis]
MSIYTIGHSDSSQEMFTSLLTEAGVSLVVDVRAFPASRKFPQFNGEIMKEWLGEGGIAYQHLPLLGGRRSRSSEVGESLNEGWDNRSFHNYADYTLTEAFQEGMAELEKLADGHTAALLCSERHPARCHRLLISNWLQANGREVVHILRGKVGKAELEPHELGRWGAPPVIEKDGTVVYPPL